MSQAMSQPISHPMTMVSDYGVAVYTTLRALRVGLAALVVLAAGCGDGGAGTSPTITVFAAASLSNAFTELGEAFTSANPGTAVTFNFAASSALVAQIGQGAPADVYASADLINMTTLGEAGHLAGEPVVFTTNLAQIIVEPRNPQGITGVADLADEDLIVISCAPEVPCGRYAEEVLDNAGVTVRFASFEENPRAVVSKVTLGEADAGIVYVTDVIAAGDAATGVEIPTAINVIAEYPIVVTRDAKSPQAAQAFIDFVLSNDGQAILESYGFGAP
jgi:molybdate transport system substrate-binding protein